MKRSYLVVTLISVTVLSLELIWTRIFSAEFYYTFAFLILSLAISGLGVGALINRMSKKINDMDLAPILSLAALSCLVGPPLVFIIGLDFSAMFGSSFEILKVTLSILILSASFIFAGIALAKIFRIYSVRLPRLYMFDLVGAGLGCAYAYFIMNMFGTPVAAALSGIPLALASSINSKKIYKILNSVLVIIMILFALVATDVLRNPVEEKAAVIQEHWDAMAKTKIYEYNEFYRGLITDNSSGSTIIGFDGNFNRPDSMKFDYGININYLLKITEPSVFLSLGAGGGMDVMQALFGKAKEVHAVEVNPYINYLMTDGELASFSGNIYRHPNVQVVTEDARAYIKKFNGKFDIIFARNTNSYAALASGAFALAENYLYTTEAFEDYWEALSSRGYIIMDHQSYGPRILSSVIDALNKKGIIDPRSHIAVYESKEFHRQLVLISKEVLTNDVIYNAFDELKYRNPDLLRILYPSDDNNIIKKIIENGWEATASEAMIDISPTTDNMPFIAQLGLWRNLKLASFDKVLPTDEFYGFPMSQLIIVILLSISLLILLPVNLLPYLKYKRKDTLKFSTWLYFLLIGLAYMSIEIILIQKYTLFIGPSIYGLMTIMSGLLIASGLGSRFSSGFGNKTIFLMIILLIVIDIFIYSELIYIFGDLDLLLRITITLIMIFPLGFFMGMPFPKAGLKTGQMIDWAFAINGSAAILGSGLILLIAFNFGFKAALFFSALIYLLSYFFLNKNKIAKN